MSVRPNINNLVITCIFFSCRNHENMSVIPIGRKQLDDGISSENGTHVVYENKAFDNEKVNVIRFDITVHTSLEPNCLYI